MSATPKNSSANACQYVKPYSQRRLSHSQALCAAAEVFLFPNRDEVAQMTQLHSDTLSLLV